MSDPRNKKLAKILVDYSIEAKKGEKVSINCTSCAGLPLAEEVYKLLLKKETIPYLQLHAESLDYYYFRHATKKQLSAKPELALFKAKWADKFISIVAEGNPKELANIDPVRQVLRNKVVKSVKDIILKKPWVLTYYPTFGMAYASSMSLHELYDFYFQACLKDWKKEKQKMDKLKRILDKGKKVKIVGYKTNISFSIENREFAVCAGKYNMPDGEVFGAPREKSVEGNVYFEFPSLYQGKEVRGVSLRFSKGKVIDFDARQHKHFLREVLKIDAGAKRLGEFGIGTNFEIDHFMQNILFDEKMGGTIHLALGAAYKEREGGGKNDSAIHWDLIKDMKKKDSKIFVDGKLIFKEGKILVN